MTFVLFCSYPQKKKISFATRRELFQLVNRASLITNLIHLSFESDIFLKFYLDVFYYVPLPTENANLNTHVLLVWYLTHILTWMNILICTSANAFCTSCFMFHLLVVELWEVLFLIFFLIFMCKGIFSFPLLIQNLFYWQLSLRFKVKHISQVVIFGYFELDSDT